MFGWEGKMIGRLRKKREDELKWLWKTKLLNSGASLLGYDAFPLPPWREDSRIDPT